MSKREIRLSVLELEKLGVTLAFPQYPDTKAEASSRRVVACLNACAGISTENLEDNKPIIELANDYNEAIRQRDELLAACLKTLSENGHLADGDNCTLIDIKLAIRSVKGGAA